MLRFVYVMVEGAGDEGESYCFPDNSFLTSRPANSFLSHNYFFTTGPANSIFSHNSCLKNISANSIFSPQRVNKSPT